MYEHGCLTDWGGVTDSGASAAAVAVLGAVADVEHRAVQPHLEAAWMLLWAASGVICQAKYATRRRCQSKFDFVSNNMVTA